MKNDPIYPLKTDLADERHEHFPRHDTVSDGVTCRSKQLDGLNITELILTSSEAAAFYGKPQGRYVTAEFEPSAFDTHALFERNCAVVSKLLDSFLLPILSQNNGCVLLVGLGNPSVPADAVGERIVRNFIVTRPVKQAVPTLYERLYSRETAAVVPDVYGNTGIEAAQLVRGTVQTLKPACVVAADALSSRKPTRLTSAVQICDTGVCPGSGVGNRRAELSEKTLGVPVVAVGIPTVVNVSCLLSDALALCGVSSEALSEKTKSALREQIGEDLHVSSKDCGDGIARIARLVGYALNASIHRSIPFSEMPDHLR